ncbi:hypothetical protein CL652_01460 [bacterium]|nr:hypothetical protein [bacterium]|tara:strand:+ start:25259 stop:25798 length:540 start_codon:yes stop_codon:yes gene_type:complete
MIVFELLYLALPAFVANMMPVFARRLRILSSLAVPMDGGRTLRGKRILGGSKTWRGLIVAVFGSVAVVIAQFYVSVPLTIETAVYDSLPVAVAYGVFVGVLVVTGDSVGSFIKRQCSIESGKPCIPLDQVDYITLFVIGTLPLIAWGVVTAVALILITFFLNLGANALAYATGIKNTYW